MKNANKQLSIREQMKMDARLIELNETSKVRALNALEKIMLHQIVREYLAGFGAVAKGE